MFLLASSTFPFHSRQTRRGKFRYEERESEASLRPSWKPSVGAMVAAMRATKYSQRGGKMVPK